MVFYSKKMEIPRITPIEFYPVVWKVWSSDKIQTLKIQPGLAVCENESAVGE